MRGLALSFCVTSHVYPRALPSLSLIHHPESPPRACPCLTGKPDSLGTQQRPARDTCLFPGRGTGAQTAFVCIIWQPNIGGWLSSPNGWERQGEWVAFVEGDESKIIPPSVKRIAYGNWTTGCRGMASLSPFPLPLEGNELTLCHDLINPHSDPINIHCYFHFTDEETEAQTGQMNYLRPCILVSGGTRIWTYFLSFHAQFSKTVQTGDSFLAGHSAKAICLGLLFWQMHQGSQ